MSITGRDLIIFILENRLEDKEISMSDIFMDVNDAAEKFGVGPHTIKAWNKLGFIDGIKIGEKLYFQKNATFILFDESRKDDTDEK